MPCILYLCVEKSLKEAVVLLKNSGIKVIAATEKAATVYTSSDMSIPIAVVMGSEDEGISNEIIRISDELIKLPQFGKIQSLNVSVAAGVIIYEGLRQRQESAL